MLGSEIMSSESRKIPTNLKLALTIREAAEYSNIGINKLESLLRTPNCPFVLYVGTKNWLNAKNSKNF